MPKLTTKLRHAGFAVSEDEPLADYDRLHVADPFGNRIELMQRKAGAFIAG